VLDLTIYAANSGVETFALLLARLEVPRAQHVWDRYLTVYLHAALEAFPKLAGKVVRELQQLHASGHSHVDADAVTASYKKAMREVTDDAVFMNELARVRNTVAAHHLTSQPGWYQYFFVLTLSIGMLLNITAVFEALDWSLGVAILVTTAVTMLMAWLAMVIAARENFSEHAGFHTDPMHMGSGVPRLRPLDLGQTEEHRVHHKEATARRLPERRRKRDK